jgi:transcriptional regulator with XRE-family HTH domain
MVTAQQAPDQGQPESPEALDDLATYIGGLSDDEKRELAVAEAALDIAILLHRARRQRGLSQEAAATLAGLKQQAVSRLERTGANLRLDTLQTYLNALGYALELSAIDIETGEIAAKFVTPASGAGRSKRARSAPPHPRAGRAKRRLPTPTST